MARKEQEGIVGLQIAGPIVFGVGYLYSIIIAVAYPTSNPGFSAIPIAGSWIMLANDGLLDGTGDVVHAIAGIAQLIGVTLTILGFVIKRDVVVPVYSTDDIQVHILPVAVPDGPGLARL